MRIAPAQFADLTGARGRPVILIQFRQAMAEAGVFTDAEILADGELHRFHITGQRTGSRNGAYRLHTDGIPAGWFMDYAAGIQRTWKADGHTSCQPIDLTARARRQAAERQAAEEAAALARRIWESAKECQDHPYLASKKVAPQPPLRVTQKGNLVIPIWDSYGNWLSIQSIAPDGRKSFLKGGKLAGGMCWFGGLDETLWICEGVATGLSIYQAIHDPVFIAFSAGNLLRVAEEIRECHPRREIIIAADNDATTGNPGLTAAEKAAKTVCGLVAVPPANGDWNDILEAA